MQVLLVDEIAESVKHGRAYQSTHPMAKTAESLTKSSLLKECHITGVPGSWFTEEAVREIGLTKQRKKSDSSMELEDCQKHSKHR